MNDPKPVVNLTTTQLENFWSRVDKSSDCWLWTGSINRDGYGNVGISGQSYLTHRVAYTAIKGEIPPMLVIDHLCRVRNCVNPEHLEAVTNRENIARGFPGRTKTPPGEERVTCKLGHRLTGYNAMTDGRGYVRCRECYRRYMRDYMASHRSTAVRTYRRFVGEPNHGTFSGYQTYKCRCDECVAAYRKYQTEWSRQSRAKKRAALLT